ncbi:MAG: glutamate-5-semialdehyde dehydrogenase, partial [Clostridiales bacterium]|nr:glutamate-5-semialdehyde dehydrogenase [Clostridiales bacterium]
MCFITPSFRRRRKMNSIDKVCAAAKTASVGLAAASGAERNKMLEVIASALKKNEAVILQANAGDLDNYTNGNPSYRDRMTLTPERIAVIADGVNALIALPDPLGTVLDEWTAAKGFRVKKISVPLGVVGIIYESRPNITVDTAALCLKSGNAVVLRGSKDSIESNKALVAVMRGGLSAAGFDPEVIQLVVDVTREGAEHFMRCAKFVDVLIPRGSAGLIRTVMEKATIPVIESGTGNCHIYVERSADPDMALKIALTAKISRPSVCNAAESLLIDDAVA